MMNLAVFLGALALGLPPQQTDTTFAVRPGATLSVDAPAGSVTVTTWERSEMRVRATHDARVEVDIDVDNGDVDIDSSTRRGGHAPVQYQITVPRSFDVEIDGLNLTVTVDGVQGEVVVENVEGAITIRGVNGNVDVESVSGAIVLDNVRGNVDLSTTNEGIRLTGVQGDVTAETVNGSIVMRRMDSARVEATTVNGTAEYDGAVRDAGRYSLFAHNGRITMSIPERANATLAITAQNGKVEAAFPVQVNTTREGRVRLTFGSGSARINLESFNGSIHLVRPAAR